MNAKTILTFARVRWRWLTQVFPGYATLETIGYNTTNSMSRAIRRWMG